MRGSVPLLAGVGAGVAYLAYYLGQPGRSVQTAVQEITALAGTRVLTASQAEMAALIGREFALAGFGWLTVAAVANAYAESRLDPDAIGDNGHAVGLFQLNSATTKAAGYGMTVEDRKNPAINTKRIIEIIRGPEGSRLRLLDLTPNYGLARVFAQDIERCEQCGYSGTSELDAREQLVYDLYGAEIAEEVPWGK